MKTVSCLTFLGLALAAMPHAHGSLVLTANTLNRTVVSASGANLISFADFQALITTTNNTALAGVLDAENPLASDLASAGISITGVVRYNRNDAGPQGLGAPSSGGSFGFVNGSETWSITPVNASNVVSHFGMIYSYYDAGALLTSVTATFTDGSTATYTPNSPAIGTYEFVGFQAPAGLGITSIATSEVAGGQWLAFDDVAYAVRPIVPEPATAVLAALSLGACFRRRRVAKER